MSPRRSKLRPSDVVWPVRQQDGLAIGGVAGTGGGTGPAGPPGPAGPTGPEGPPGTGIAIQGSVPTADDLPPSGAPGDAWIASDTGHLWVWDADAVASAYAPAIVTDAPRGYWRLGEASGTVAVDSSGHGRDGAYVGGVTLGQASALVDGNTAALFNGSTGEVSNASAALQFSTGPFSLEVFVKLGAGSSDAGIAGRGVPNGMQLTWHNGTTIYFYAGNTNINAALSGAAWHHLVGTWDGTTGANGIKLYIDGALVAQGTAAGTGITASPFTIGNCVPGSFFNGSIDEVALYPTVLSPAQIATHYALASTPAVGAWVDAGQSQGPPGEPGPAGPPGPPAGPHAPTHEPGGSDVLTSLPTPDQKAALVSVGSTPSGTNPYVNTSDGRLADARIPLAHHLEHEFGHGDEILNINAGRVTSGTLDDARLSSNVQMKPIAPADLPTLPTTGEKAALVGTAGAPSASNPYVTTVDPRLPTQDQKDALISVGSTPSGTNPYVNTSDGRLTDARTALPHHLEHEFGHGDEILNINAARVTSGTLNDARLSANVQMKPIAAADLPTHHTRHEPGGADALVVDAAAAVGSLRTLGTGATQAAAGNDARFGGAPAAHHATHEAGGADAITGSLHLANASAIKFRSLDNTADRIGLRLTPASEAVEVGWDAATGLINLIARNVQTAGFYNAGPDEGFYLQGRGGLTAIADGALLLSNWGAKTAGYPAAAFDRLMFGWTNAEFPCLKRNGVGLEVRLANDAALTTLRALLSATDLTSGTVPDARLSANVPLLNAANVFTANQQINGALGIGIAPSTAILEVHKDWNGSSALNLMASFTAYDDAARFVIRRANGNVGAETAVLSGETLGNLNFRGWHSGGGFTTGVASIAAIPMENFTATAGGTALSFATAPLGSWVSPERMRLLAAGHLRLEKLATDPGSGDLSSLAQMAVYMKNNKFVIAYNNAGAITYISIPMNGATTTWTHSTTAP